MEEREEIVITSSRSLAGHGFIVNWLFIQCLQFLLLLNPLGSSSYILVIIMLLKEPS